MSISWPRGGAAIRTVREGSSLPPHSTAFRRRLRNANAIDSRTSGARASSRWAITDSIRPAGSRVHGTRSSTHFGLRRRPRFDWRGLPVRRGRPARCRGAPPSLDRLVHVLEGLLAHGLQQRLRRRGISSEVITTTRGRVLGRAELREQFEPISCGASRRRAAEGRTPPAVDRLQGLDAILCDGRREPRFGQDLAAAPGRVVLSSSTTRILLMMTFASAAAERGPGGLRPRGRTARGSRAAGLPR